MMKFNLLMLVDVLGLLLHPNHAAWVRSAGCVGADAFHEAVERGLVPTHLTYTDTDLSEEHSIPLSFPFCSRPTVSNRCTFVDSSEEVVQTQSLRAIKRNLPNSRNICCVHQHFDGGHLEHNIPDYFMSDDDRPVKSIRFTNVELVTQIADYFMWTCDGLRYLDMTPFSGLQQVGEYFAGRCTELAGVAFHPAVKLRSLPLGFLFQCKALKQLDMSLFESVDAVMGNFLVGCTSLTEINLGPLLKMRAPLVANNATPVAAVGGSFLLNCSGLERVLNMEVLSGIAEIEDRWMSQCKSLRNISLSAFQNVTAIRSHFLSECKSLEKIDMSCFGGSVTSIGSYFLWNCTGLTSVSLNSFVSLKSIDDFCMSECTSLKEVQMEALHPSTGSQIDEVGAHFMRACPKLESIDIRPLSGLTELGAHFLSGCVSLPTMDFSLFCNVERIGYGMLHATTPVIDLSSMTALEAIPEGVVEGDKRVVLPKHLQRTGKSTKCRPQSKTQLQ